MLKKLWIILMIAVLLTGCGAQETFETVADEYVQPAAAMPLEIMLTLPHEAAAASMVNENDEKLYLCDGYTITVQTMQAGDLSATVRAVSGYAPDALTVLQTNPGTLTRYDFIWSSAGETGTQLGRAAILDDGNYHYVLTCMAPEENSGALQQTWDSIFASFWAI